MNGNEFLDKAYADFYEDMRVEAARLIEVGEAVSKDNAMELARRSVAEQRRKHYQAAESPSPHTTLAMGEEMNPQRKAIKDAAKIGAGVMAGAQHPTSDMFIDATLKLMADGGLDNAARNFLARLTLEEVDILVGRMHHLLHNVRRGTINDSREDMMRKSNQEVPLPTTGTLEAEKPTPKKPTARKPAAKKPTASNTKRNKK